MNKEWDNPAKEKELIEREKRRSEQRFEDGKSPTTAPFSQSVRPGLPIGGAKEGKWFQEWCYDWASLLLNSCLSGAPMLVFGGTRTSHRLACAIEDAGWQIRDTIMWVYSTGFPKSLDISKAIDKQAGLHKPELVPTKEGNTKHNRGITYATDTHAGFRDISEPQSPEAKLWEGYGTALKPAYEPIILAMKPIDGTFANNALKHKVAGLNIDATRIGYASEADKEAALVGDAFKRKDISDKGWSRPWMEDEDKIARINADAKERAQQGRFPANFIHDGSQEVMELFPDTKSGSKKGHRGKPNFNYQGIIIENAYNDSGSAARFFKTCEQDTCNLFSLLLLLRYGIMNIGGIPCKTQQKLNTLAQTVEEYFGSILATIENTAPQNVVGKQGEPPALNVKYAESQCDICGIHIALVLAKIKTLDFSHEELQAIQAYTGNSNTYTLIQNLVFYAGKLENTDTIQIITDLLTSFGCVNPAIIDSTQETRRSEPHRFLYTAKASRRERDAGLEDMPEKDITEVNQYKGLPDLRMNHEQTRSPIRNPHPTVKPLSLMTYLIKLVKMPEYNLILDPFCGSGSTLLACKKLGIPCIGIDSNEEYCEIASKRCMNARNISIYNQGVSSYERR